MADGTGNNDFSEANILIGCCLEHHREAYKDDEHEGISGRTLHYHMIVYYRDKFGKPILFKISKHLLEVIEPVIKTSLDENCYGHVEFTKSLPKAVRYIKKEGNFWFNTNTEDY